MKQWAGYCDDDFGIAESKFTTTPPPPGTETETEEVPETGAAAAGGSGGVDDESVDVMGDGAAEGGGGGSGVESADETKAASTSSGAAAGAAAPPKAGESAGAGTGEHAVLRWFSDAACTQPMEHPDYGVEERVYEEGKCVNEGQLFSVALKKCRAGKMTADMYMGPDCQGEATEESREHAMKDGCQKEPEDCVGADCDYYYTESCSDEAEESAGVRGVVAAVGVWSWGPLVAWALFWL